MDVLGLLFSFRGRMGRLMYFAASLTTAVVVSAIAAFLAISFFVTVLSGMDVSMMLSALPLLLVVLSLWVVSTWIAAALSVKRLHDMGRSPMNALWIVGCYAGAAVDPTGGLLLLVSLAGWAWLVAARGEVGPNRHGPEPSRHLPAASQNIHDGIIPRP